jgi:hypothetical protein
MVLFLILALSVFRYYFHQPISFPSLPTRRLFPSFYVGININISVIKRLICLPGLFSFHSDPLLYLAPLRYSI